MWNSLTHPIACVWVDKKSDDYLSKWLLFLEKELNCTISIKFEQKLNYKFKNGNFNSLKFREFVVNGSKSCYPIGVENSTHWIACL